jgi:uncharacterized protein (TIGR02246 family)
MDKKVVLDFIDAINNHDLRKMADLMTEDHVFINSHGKKSMGKENMEQGWKGYFEFFPDYTIEVENIIEGEGVLAVLGQAHATYMNKRNKRNSNFWKLPCAWKAKVQNDRIKLWQVYSDTKVPYEIIEENLQ